MLRDEASSMKKSKLKQITSSLQHLFGLHMRYFTRSSKKTNEIEEVDLEKIVPQPA